MANAIDIITLQDYYDWIERQYTCPLTQSDATTIAGRITMASSYLEQQAKRPLTPDSEIDVPTDADGDEITKYQPFDSPNGSASPAKTMPPELELGCCILVRYYGMKAEYYGVTSDGSTTKSKTFNVQWPVEVDNMLVKYTYYVATDYTEGR